MKTVSTRIFAPLALAAVVGVGSASAADMTATIINNSTETANLRTSNYSLEPSIDPGASGGGVYSTGQNPNVTANATYRSSDRNIGCFFTAQAVYNRQRGRYTFSSAAQRVGVSGGVLATCTSQITNSNSTTGDSSVTYRISGF